mgnify:CR=1 FL=1
MSERLTPIVIVGARGRMGKALLREIIISESMVLEAAVNAGASAIVTYNLRDFAPAANFGILVLNPEQTFKRFQLRKPAMKDPTP